MKRSIFLIIIIILFTSAISHASCSNEPASYRSFNYGALTLRKHLVGSIPHYEGWPGYIEAKNITDAEGNEIMYFSTIESGIAAWWAWFDRKGFSYDHYVTWHQIAQIYGDNIERKINVYVRQWSALSSRYFGRKIGTHDKIWLNDKTQRWALARTMFRHEAGEGCPLPFDQQTFERGLRLARDHLKKRDPISMKSNINLQAYTYDD